MLKLLLVVGLCCISLAAHLGYEVNYDRLELTYVERSYIKDSYFFFGKYNRTNYCFNVSFYLLRDLDGNNIQCTTSVHQLIGTDYKSLGLQLTFNVCEHYKNNIFGIKSQLAQYGNLTACDIRKGFYYMYNFMPDESFFPKLLPLGSYMIQMHVRRNDGKVLLTFRWFGSAKFTLPTRKPRTF